jgi:signal transduction histidine kinase
MGSRHADSSSRDRSASGRAEQVSEETLSELEVLQGMSRAFGSAITLDEAAKEAIRWAQAAAGAGDARVRLFLLHPDGALHPVAARLEAAEDPDRRAARRRILNSLRASRTVAPSGQTLATLPLVTRGVPVGVLEMIAPSASVEERWATVEAAASQMAIVFRNLTDRAQLVSDAEGLQHTATLAGAMARTHDPREAVRKAVRFYHERFQRPVGGWLMTHDPSRYELVSVRGAGSSRTELRSKLRVIDGRELRTSGGRRRAASRFAAIVGVPEAGLVHAGGAVFFLGTQWPPESSWSVESLLEDVLANVSLVAASERRSRGLDIGLALTAHEIRGPLIGTLAIIEYILMHGTEQLESRGLLERSRDQLEQLSRLVDGLLRWAVGGQQVDLEGTDLMAIVREAVEWTSQETGSHRVVISGPDSVSVLAGPPHLRAAISNVVRNALVYSPPDSEVSVSVGIRNGRATVSVCDRGPGIPPAERELIFDPFMRGSAAHLARSGNGLGLFIARRVMEAHAGRIWLASTSRGAAFQLQLPTTQEI